MNTKTETDNEQDLAEAEAFARALAYSDEVGLSDGTDRPAATVAELGEIAHPERHTYGSSGRVFYLVPCYRCGIVLNSGHHYPEVDGAPSPFAVQIADEHNAAAHELADVSSWPRAEHEPCQRGTDGCSVDHEGDEPCAPW